MTASPAFLTVQQRLLLDHLRHTRGSPLPVERLIAVLYGSRADGGPDHAAKVVTTQMCKLRKVLKATCAVDVLTIGLGRGAQGYMIDPDHLDRLEAALAQMAAIAIDLARSRL